MPALHHIDGRQGQGGGALAPAAAAAPSRGPAGPAAAAP